MNYSFSYKQNSQKKREYDKSGLSSVSRIRHHSAKKTPVGTYS